MSCLAQGFPDGQVGLELDGPREERSEANVLFWGVVLQRFCDLKLFWRRLADSFTDQPTAVGERVRG